MMDKPDTDIKKTSVLKPWSLLGLILVERKTDILALAAFLVALASSIYQISSYLQGPEIRLFPPDQIMFEKREGPGEKQLLGIVAPMNYVNTGGAGYNGIVRREVIRFNLEATPYKYIWQEFGKSTSTGKKLKFESLGEAQPFSVSGGSSISHETRFGPYRPRCKDLDRDCLNKNFLTVESFFDAIKRMKQLKIEFAAQIYSDKETCVSCVIDIDPSLWSYLADPGWVTVSCWENEN